MASLIPIPFLAVTVYLLVRAQFQGSQRQIYLFKPLSTLLVIVVALLSLTTSGAQPSFTFGITLGLVLSMGGDVALMFKAGKAFLVGLILFLLAHIEYSLTFTVLNGFHSQDLITAALLLAIALPIYLFLQPGLGRMRTPVILYILVISLMVNRAISTFFGDAFTISQAWLMTVGAVLFWLSDLLLGINRFRLPFKAEPFGLFPYYGGQSLIALSPSFFPS